MKSIFFLCIFLLLLLSCEQKSQLEGLWWATYYQEDEQVHYNMETRLFDFHNKQLLLITIRDLPNGNLSKVTIDTFDYAIRDSRLIFGKYRPTFQISTDSLILGYEGDERVQILKRISPVFNKVKLRREAFRGTYVINSSIFPNYKDTVSFLSDSIVSSTQVFAGRNPKWGIVSYKGYQFFNRYFELYPILLVKSFSEKGMSFYYPSIGSDNILTFTPLEGYRDKKSLLGKWQEISISPLRIPPPPTFSGKPRKKSELIYQLEISEDSLVLEHLGKTQKNKWELTSDGNRIYQFKGVYIEEEPWKILELNDTNLIIEMNQNSLDHPRELVTFQREKKPK